jgi:hypothetical protein
VFELEVHGGKKKMVACINFVDLNKVKNHVSILRSTSLILSSAHPESALLI